MGVVEVQTLGKGDWWSECIRADLAETDSLQGAGSFGTPLVPSFIGITCANISTAAGPPRAPRVQNPRGPASLRPLQTPAAPQRLAQPLPTPWTSSCSR